VSGVASAVARRDDLRLARLQRGATWIASASALGLLGLLPEPGRWVGVGGLILLLLLTPFGAHLSLPVLRKAPAVLGPLGLVLALVLGVDATAVVAGTLALLLVAETLGTGPSGAPRRVPLFCLFAALLACTTCATALLAPLLAVAGISCAAALMLVTLVETEGARRSRAVTGPRQLLPLVGLLLALAMVSVLAFLALPRHPGRAAQVPVPTHRLVGYAEQVHLGELAGALSDPTPLFRVRVSDAGGQPVPGPFHYRGVVLDHFDGRTWSARAATGPTLPSTEQADSPVVQRFRFEPTAPPILVGVPRLEAISVPPEDLQLAPSGTLLHRDGPRVHGYTAWSRLDGWDPLAAWQGAVPDGAVPADYLQLPASLSADILARARGAVEGVEDPAERAQVLVALLSREHRYEHQPAEPLGGRPLEAFLLDGKPGHCELFATSLALMLRAVDIPSRVVNGFFGGEYNPVGRYWLVRHADAHAWVEAWLPGRGWVSLDPTPAPQATTTSLAAAVADHASSQWTHGVLAIDGQTQIEALAAPGAKLRQLLEPAPATPSLEPPSRGLDLLLSLLMVATMVGGLALSWRRVAPWMAGERQRHTPATGEVERALRAGRRLLRQRGWDPPPHLPPAAAARWLESAAGPVAGPFTVLAQLHYRVRYAGVPDAALAGEALEALEALRAMPRADESS
jgi:transglutaminase-like putative cysteine protease